MGNPVKRTFLSRPSHYDPVARRTLLSIVTAVVLVAMGALGLVVVASAHQRPVAHSSTAGNLRSIATPQAVGETVYATDGERERLCGSVLVIDELTSGILDTRPDAGLSQRPVDGHQLIAYANALNHIDRSRLSGTTSAAVTAHSYALVNLGAMIDHHATVDDISSMAAVVHATGAVLREFCRQ